MKIERNGAENDRGTYDTTLNVKLTAWSEERTAILLQAFYVHDFATNARHHWKMSLTLAEAVEIIKALSAGVKENASIRAGLSPDLLGPLLELALVAQSNVGATATETAA